MRIASGDTSRKIAFVAVDATDYATRETGLTTFTVYRSRDGGTATAMTTPTVAELDATNMPGVYVLTLDEDMTVTASVDSEEMTFHITATGMAPVTRTIELYRPKITAGETLTVASGIGQGSVQSIAANAINAASINTGAITSGKFAAGAITATSIAASALNGKGNWNIGKTGYTLTQAFPANFSTLAITATTGRVTAGTVIDKTGYSISGTLTTLDGLNNLSAADVNAEVDTAISDAALATAASLVTVDSNVDAILTDTNELQTNQGDWATATGFATAADLVTVDANVDAILVDTGTTIPGQIAALNDLDAAGVRAAVGLASANLDTQIGAIDTNVDAVLVDTNELQANQGNWITATGFATSGALATVDSNVDAILVDTGTTLPATLSGLSTFDATTDTVDVGAIDGSTTAAARLSDSAETMVLGAAITGTLSTTEMTTDLAESTDDHYNGRVIIWTSGVLVNQATDITDYNGTTKALTYTAVTEAPSNGDTFIIV